MVNVINNVTSYQEPEVDIYVNQQELLIDSSQDLLINAALNNNVFELKHLLNSGININKLEDGWSVLHWLTTLTYPIDVLCITSETNCINNIKVPKKYINAIQLLIDNGADVNIQGSVKDTPLHQIANLGILDVCVLLLKNGALVNVKDDGDWSPLHFAVISGNSIITRLLIAYGADLNEIMNNEFVLSGAYNKDKNLPDKLKKIYNGSSSYTKWLKYSKDKHVKNLENMFKNINSDNINIIVDYILDTSKEKWLNDVWIVSIHDVHKLMLIQDRVFNSIYS